MQLIFKVRDSSARVDWSEYAHYLEGKSGQASFAALHGVERAVDGGVASLDATELRSDLTSAWATLGGLTLAESAISLRTRAILTGCARMPLVRGTVLASVSGWRLPVAGDGRQPLRKYLSDFVESVLAITAAATPTDDVYVKKQAR
jgi:hypothetical protein